MMKSFTVISLLTTAALAQSSAPSSAATTSTSNPLIPSGISTGCQAFLTQLNGDTNIASCLAPIVSASSAYTPGGNATSKPTAATITSTLDELCSPPTSSSCSDSTIRSALANFTAACSPELTSNRNTDVVGTYDVLYAMIPFKAAVCSKDQSGNYCVINIPSTLSNSTSTGPNGTTTAIAVEDGLGMSPSDIQKYLVNGPTTANTRRAEAAITPNMTTFGSTNLVFLFLNPSLPSTALCTPCTRDVVTSYINSESNSPYAPGFGASLLFGGQPALYSAVQNVCGASFLSGAVQAAGGLTAGMFNGATRSNNGDFKGTVAAMLGAAVFSVALLF